MVGTWSTQNKEKHLIILLNNVVEETKSQCGNNIKMGAAETRQDGVDSIQLFEMSTRTGFNEFNNAKPGTTGSE